MEVTLKCGRAFLVDQEDWDRLNLAAYRWRILKKKWCYVVADVWDRQEKRQKTIYLHRLIAAPKDGEFVDHINGDPLDSRRCNLRLCTHAQNQANTSARKGSSRHKGVSWYTRKSKWLVAFRTNGEYVFVGYFDDETEAAKAYNREASKRLGDFARLNAV